MAVNLQEESLHYSKLIAIQTTKLTTRLLASLFLKVLNRLENRPGEISLKKLNKKNGKLEEIPLPDNMALHDFRKLAKKYNLEFATLFDKNTGMTYINFGAVDQVKINQIMREFIAQHEKELSPDDLSLWQKLKEKFPKIERQPAYQLSIETPDKKQIIPFDDIKDLKDYLNNNKDELFSWVKKENMPDFNQIRDLPELKETLKKVSISSHSVDIISNSVKNKLKEKELEQENYSNVVQIKDKFVNTEEIANDVDQELNRQGIKASDLTFQQTQFIAVLKGKKSLDTINSNIDLYHEFIKKNGLDKKGINNQKLYYSTPKLANNYNVKNSKTKEQNQERTKPVVERQKTLGRKEISR